MILNTSTTLAYDHLLPLTNQNLDYLNRVVFDFLRA
jgi:hypothetical protein